MANNNFYSKIRNIEARMNKLKSIGLSSSSSITIKEVSCSVYLKIIPTRVDEITGEVLDCGSSQFCSIKIRTKNNESALFGMRLVSPTTFTQYLYVNKIGGGDNTYKYGFDIDVIGSQTELDILTNGGTLPVVEYKFKIIGTSDFSINITYRDREL